MQRTSMRKMIIALVLGIGWLFGSMLAHADTHPLNGIIYSKSSDPTTPPGVSAPLWQLLIRTDTGAIYYKSGSAATAWTAMSSGGGGPTGSGTANTLSKWTAASVLGDATGLTQTASGILAISGTPGTTSLTVASTTANGIAATRTATAGTSSNIAGIQTTSTGTFDTTAGDIFSFGIRAFSTGTRSAGANDLWNYGVLGVASGGQQTSGVVGSATGGTNAAGVTGVSDATGTVGYGVKGNARGAATTNYGVYSEATGAGTNYSGYFDTGLFQVQGAATFSSTLTSVGAFAVGPGGGETNILATDGSMTIGNPTVVAIDGTTGAVTLQGTGGLTIGSGGLAINTTRFTVDGTSGNTVALGTLTADGGLRVFDIAGAGLTSTNNTVQAVCLTGLTCNADSLQIEDRDFGDITASASGATWTIDNQAVTFAKMQNVNTATFAARSTGGAGSLESLTATQATALLDTFSTSATTKGLVPGSNGGGASVFLNGNGGWTTPSAGIGGSATAPGVLYASSANTAATEASDFAWYATENTLNVGTAAVTGCGAGACDNGLNVTSAGADVPVRSWNSSATGYNGFAWNNSTPTPQGAIGFGNATAGITAYRGLNFISSDSADYIFGEVTTGSVIARVFMTAGSAGIQWANGSSGAVGAANTGKLRYNSTTQTFQSSQNGAAFANIPTGTATVNTVPRSASSTTGALVDSAIVDDGSTVTSSRTVRATFLSGDVAGSAPTVSSCGTSPTQPSASDTNVAGTFGVGSSASGACTLNFVGTAASAPICWVVRDTGGGVADAGLCGSTTSCTFAALSDSITYHYICLR